MRVSSHREAAAADAAERPGCNGGGGARRSFEKPKVETWAPRMSSHREAPAANAAGRPSCNGKGEQEEAENFCVSAKEACHYEQKLQEGRAAAEASKTKNFSAAAREAFEDEQPQGSGSSRCCGKAGLQWGGGSRRKLRKPKKWNLGG